MKNVLVFAVLTLGLGLPPSSSAGTLAPTKASDLRTVLGSAPGTPCPGAPAFRTVDLQQNPDGTSGPFSIPAKNVFIMTSFDVQVAGTAGAAAETLLGVSDGVGNLAHVGTCGGIVGSNGIAVASCSTPVGVAAKSGSTLCFNGLRVVVHGFMAKDK